MELIDIGLLRLALLSAFLLLTVESGDMSSTVSNASPMTASPVTHHEDPQATSVHADPTPVTPATDKAPGTQGPPAGDASPFATTAIAPPNNHASTVDGSTTHNQSFVSITTTTTMSKKPPSTSKDLSFTGSKDSLKSSPTGVSSTSDPRGTTTRSMFLPTKSSSSPGVPIPGITTTTRRLTAAGPGPVTKQGTRGSPGPGVLDCATQSQSQSQSALISQCLISIGVLAVLLTVFIVSTVVLCTRLSSRKYHFHGGLQLGTEMVCISALMHDRNDSNGGSSWGHVDTKGRRTLLMGLEDSDDDGGDNLTLNSFLPDGERMV